MPATGQHPAEPRGSGPPPSTPNPAEGINTDGYEAGPPGRVAAHGQFFIRYRNGVLHHSAGRSAKSFVTYGIVATTYNVNRQLEAYLRYGFELVSPEGRGRDFDTNYYQGFTGWRGAAAFDQFGLLYRSRDGTLVVNAGRQDQALDPGGGLYDLTFYVGRYTFLDGVSVVKSIGGSTAQGYAFSEDQYRTHATRNGLYAMRTTYPVSAHTTLGIMLAHFQSSAENQAAGIASTTNYEGDIEQDMGRLRITAEYGRSNASTGSELYYVGGRYPLTRKDTLIAFTYSIGQNADLGQDTGHNNNFRGQACLLRHSFSPQVDGVAYVESAHSCTTSTTVNLLRLTLQYSF